MKISKNSDQRTTSETKPGRPRSAILRKKILQAALSLLQKHGLHKVSVEAIASRAGVGKSTIYRWWPNKSAVLMEAFLEMVAPAIKYSQTDHPLNDVLEQMRGLAKTYGTPPGNIFFHLIAQAQFDKELADELRKFVIERREQAKTALNRAITAGLIRQDIDVDVTLDQLYAPIFYRLLAAYAEVGDDFIEKLFQQILNGIRTSTKRH